MLPGRGEAHPVFSILWLGRRGSVTDTTTDGRRWCQ
jgi:hypothetical protein